MYANTQFETKRILSPLNYIKNVFSLTDGRPTLALGVGGGVKLTHLNLAKNELSPCVSTGDLATPIISPAFIFVHLLCEASTALQSSVHFTNCGSFCGKMHV